MLFLIIKNLFGTKQKQLLDKIVITLKRTYTLESVVVGITNI